MFTIVRHFFCQIWTTCSWTEILKSSRHFYWRTYLTKYTFFLSQGFPIILQANIVWVVSGLKLFKVVKYSRVIQTRQTISGEEGKRYIKKSIIRNIHPNNVYKIISLTAYLMIVMWIKIISNIYTANNFRFSTFSSYSVDPLRFLKI